MKKGISNWGGHLLNPPDICKYSRTFKDGSTWTDFGNCQKNCPDKCKEYIDFIKMKEDDKRRWLIDHGVIGLETQEELKAKQEIEKKEPTKQCKYKRR